MNNVPKEKILNEVKSLIDKYLVGQSSRTVQSLATKSGINGSTLRRAYQLKSLPDHANLLKLVHAVYNETTITVAIEKSPSHIKGILKDNFSFLFNQNKQSSLSNEVLNILSDPDTYVLFTLANNGKGITREIAQNVIGADAPQKIEILLDNKIIIEENGLLVTSLEESISTPMGFIKKMLPTLFRFYRPHKPGNFIFFNSNSLSHGAYTECIYLYDEFYKRVTEITNNKENEGTYQMFALGLVELITTDRIDKN